MHEKDVSSPLPSTLSQPQLMLRADPPSEPASDATPSASAAKVTDERLVRLVRSHFDNVWRALRRLGVPEAHCDDASQEVFIVASRKLHDIAETGERQYLYAVAVRVAANARRSHSARRDHADESALLSEPSPVPNNEALLEEKQARQLLDQVLDTLPQELRTVFVLFEIEGFSLRELEQLLEVPLGTVSSRLRRAREAFHHSAQRIKRVWLGSRRRA